MEILDATKLKSTLSSAFILLTSKYEFGDCKSLTDDKYAVHLRAIKNALAVDIFYHPRESLNFSLIDIQNPKNQISVDGIFSKNFVMFSEEINTYQKERHEHSKANSADSYEYHLKFIEYDISYLESNYPEILTNGVLPKFQKND